MFTNLQIVLIFALVWLALIFSGFWEASVEGRRAWDKGKLGWRVRWRRKTVMTSYHFYLFGVMYPLLLGIPFIFTGWNLKLFGILLSAYTTGLIIEDFTWYLVNPVVSFREWFTPFSDYYPWIRLSGRKIVPVGYVLGVLVAWLSWYLIWS